MRTSTPLAKTRMGIPPLIAVLLAPRWDVAAETAIRETQARGIGKDRDRRQWLDAMALDHAKARLDCIEMAGKVEESGHEHLRLCWQLLAADPADRSGLAKVLRDIKTALRGVDWSEYAQLAPRLRVMDDVADGKQAGEFGSIFHLASVHRDDAEREIRNRPLIVPAPVGLLKHDTWDAAAADVWNATVDVLDDRAVAMPAGWFASRRPSDQAGRAQKLIDALFAVGSREAGELAIAWMMLLCEPRSPSALHAVLPQVQRLLDGAPMNEFDRAEYQLRLDVWWTVAQGRPRTLESKETMFAIACKETGPVVIDEDDSSMSFESLRSTTTKLAAQIAERLARAPLHSVVVLKSARADKNLPHGWKEMIDLPLPCIIAGDVAAVRRTLHDEYPHAPSVIDGLLRDVREGRPIRLTPTLLVGSPGSGKSRLVRRLAELLGGLHVARYDASASMDATFSGTPRAWSNSHASVPATAVLSSRTANPIVLVDEIEKSASSSHNGLLWSAILPYLDGETSGRHRETGLNSELDLSRVSYIATANSVDPLPSPLRDRFRILRVPAPTLAHLPKLAAHVLKEIMRDDDARSHDQPLADDELAIIGRAWSAEKFSMRKLQRIVAATLEVRDQMARRH
jgi:ATP-dependent Lon protease